MSEDDPADYENVEPYIETIAPDVIAVLTHEKFFASLEDRIFPSATIHPSKCDHTFRQTLELLASFGHDEEAQNDVLQVMRSRGGFCDCEILLNVAPESAVRTAYWKARAAEMK